MRFLDANVVIYDSLKLERKLDNRTSEIKESAHKIIGKIKSGEEVVTTVVHISEVSNILQNLLHLEKAQEIVSDILDCDFIKIEDVNKEKYMESVEIAKQNKIKINDGLAVVAMKNLGIEEIYSFDEHFDKIEGIKRVEK
jgi:hypothetical protein